VVERVKYGEKGTISFTEVLDKVKWFKLGNRSGWINNTDHVATVECKKDSKQVNIRGGSVPIYRDPPADGKVMVAEPKFTGKYIGSNSATSKAKLLTVETSEVKVISNIIFPGVGLAASKNKRKKVSFYKLSDGSGWISDMHFKPHETSPDIMMKATGCGRAALLSIICAYERSTWFVKPLLMVEKLAAAIIVVGVGSSTSGTMGVWMAFAFTLSTALIFVILAPYISQGEDKMDAGQRTSITFFTLLAALFQQRAFKGQAKLIGTFLLFINSIVSCIFMVTALNPVALYTKIRLSLKQGRALAKYSVLDENAIKKLLFVSKFNPNFPNTAKRVSDRKAWMMSIDELAVSCLTDAQLALIVLYGGDICLSSRFFRERLTYSPAVASDVMASAAAGGHVSVMEHLMQTIPELNVNKAVRGKWYNDRTPLMLAAAAGSLDACRFIAKHNTQGASNLTKITSAMNPLHCSVFHIDTDFTDGSNLPEIFEFLLSDEVGVDVNAKTADDDGYTILHLLCQNSDLHKLHLKNKRQEQQQKAGVAVVMNAVAVDDLVLKLTKMVVESGCSLYEVDKQDKNTCLHVLCEGFGNEQYQPSSDGQFKQLEYLIERWKMSEPPKKKKNQLDQNPLKAKNDTSKTMLHLACQLDCSPTHRPRRSSLAPKLIEMGADAHAQDDEKHAPIWQAVENANNVELVRLFLSLDPAFAKSPGLLNAAVVPSSSLSEGAPIIDALLDAGADINTLNESDESPLHSATIYSNPGAVKTLLQRGASVFVKDGSGKTVLELAQSDVKERPTDGDTRSIFKMISEAAQKQSGDIQVAKGEGLDLDLDQEDKEK
jgi:ankyrin repeat protein